MSEPAATALALLAIDPVGLGGAVLRGGGAERTRTWVAATAARLPDPHRVRRVPAGMAEERLSGGLDLAATLLTGRPVLEPGLCALAHGAALVVPMAERLSVGAAAQLSQVLDEQVVRIERDGLSATLPAALALLLLDESEPDEAEVSAALRDRVAFDLAIPHAEPADIPPPAVIAAARVRLGEVRHDTSAMQALVGVAHALGVASVRAPLLALRAARAHAALRGAAVVADEDVAPAAALVLAPRTTQLPAPAPEVDEPPPPESEREPGDDSTASSDEPRPLDDRILDATIAALPPDLLARLAAACSKQDRAGRAGGDAVEGPRGRRRGQRRGRPAAGARLDLLATIRAAVPWQRLRGDARPGERLAVRPDDFRIVRRIRPAGTTTIVLVDASGSTALHRLQEAKGAVELLLAESYVRRDEVALIAFRGAGAEVALPPTRALARARRALAGLPGGGGTPLAAALDAATLLAMQVRGRGGRPGLVILSDGKANVPRAGSGGRPAAQADALQAAQRLVRDGVPAVWLDVGPRPPRRRCPMSKLHVGVALAAVILVTGCELPPQESVQTGYRGVGIQQVYSPERLAATAALHAAPKPQPPAPADSTKAGAVYQNVQVLGHVSNTEFVRTMAAITEWVAPKSGPEAGCAYCHNTANMASDEKYQKVVSRSMLRMTQHINANWTGHVQQTGVSCYTCHRGNQVPAGTWFYTDVNQSLRHYLDRNDMRVQTGTVLRSEVDNPTSINQTEYAYELMIGMSSALGVNCTYCHNSRQWSSWEESSPKRFLALRGVRMVRDANLNYMLPLLDVWPSARHAASHLTADGSLFTPHINANVSRGPMGDGAKLQCTTCHQGVYKPLYGKPMAPDYPALYPAPAPVVTDTATTVAVTGG